MKKPNPISVPPRNPQALFKVSALTLALAAISMPAMLTHAAVSYDINGAASYNTLGDLSIYQPPTGEIQPAVMLMLDKSGSMGNFTQGRQRIDSLWEDYGSFDYKRGNYVVVENREVIKGDWERECNYWGRNCRWVDRRYTVIEPTNVT